MTLLAQRKHLVVFSLSAARIKHCIPAMSNSFLLSLTSESRLTGSLTSLVRIEHLRPPRVSQLPAHTIAVNVNGKSFIFTSGNIAAIDTGTTLIGGPTVAVSAIYAQIPGSQRLTGGLSGFYGFRMSTLSFLTPLLDFFLPACTSTVSISFSFGGKTWPINSQDMNIGRVSTDPSICGGAIFDLDGTGGVGFPSWVMGATFFKNVYSVFRYQPAAIGFAELRNTVGGPSGECPFLLAGSPCPLVENFN